MKELRTAALKLMRDGLSQRKACALVGINLSTFHYEPHPRKKKIPDENLAAYMKKLAHKHRRFGVPRIHALIVKKFGKINYKRVERLWAELGLTVWRRRPRKRKHYEYARGITRASGPNEVWTYDFLFDWLEGNRRLKILVVADEFTRELLVIRPELNIQARHVRETMLTLFEERGAPKYLRSDNGGEFIERELLEMLAKRNLRTLFIAPGHPWENPFIESFNSRFRDECLNEEVFTTLREAKIVIEKFRRYYIKNRPHSSLGYKTPAEFVAGWKKAEREKLLQ